MITSAAETPSPLWMSVGMPRPLSSTVTEPSALSVTMISSEIAGQRLVDGVVDHLIDHVVQARAVVGVADIHARPLAHGVEAFQHLDRLGAVFGRGLRLCVLRLVSWVLGSGCWSCWRASAAIRESGADLTPIHRQDLGVLRRSGRIGRGPSRSSRPGRQAAEFRQKVRFCRASSRWAATSSRRTRGAAPSISVMSSALARMSPIRSAFCSPEEQCSAGAFFGP